MAARSTADTFAPEEATSSIASMRLLSQTVCKGLQCCNCLQNRCATHLLLWHERQGKGPRPESGDMMAKSERKAARPKTEPHQLK